MKAPGLRLFIFLSLPFLFVSSFSHAANIEAILDSNDGSSVFSIQDSGAVEVGHVDSDGNSVFKGCLRIDSGGAECTDVEGLVVDGNITISGNRLLMGTNTSGAILVADGTGFNPVVASGDVSISTTGVVTIGNDRVGAAQISSSGVTAGHYMAPFINIDQDGRITTAANGSLTGLSDIGNAAVTSGNLLVADGTKFQSVTMAGSCTLSASGAINCTGDGGALALTGLTDVGSANVTAANILVADGTKYQSVAVSGDITITSAGVTAIGNDKVGPNQLIATSVTPGTYGVANITVDADGRLTGAAAGSLTGLSNVGSETITAGNLLVADGTLFQSVAMSGDCSINGNGVISCLTSGVTALTGLSDVGSANVTAANILVADGTQYQSVAVSGDITITSAGAADIGSDKVGPTELQSTSVSAGTYGAANITVDADGRVTNASAGSLTGLSNVGSATITAGNLLVADGTKFQSVTMSNDCTLASDGAITCTNGGANSLTGLSDVGSASVTAANILVADGTKYQSVAVSGDITITSAGATDIGSDKVGPTELQATSVSAGTYGAANITVDADGRVTNASAGSLTGLSNVGSATITAGNLLVADGTKFQSVTMSNDCTLASDGAITCADATGATSLTGLSDVGSASVTAANILVADGTKYQSVAVSGDITITSAGATDIGSDKVGPTELQSTSVSAGTYGAANITVDADGRVTNASAGSLTGLSNVGSATITAGNLLVADGTKFQSVTMSNDCTLASDGAITCTNGGATSLTGLTDVGSANVTAANILVADGTKYQSVAVSGDITITSAGAADIGSDKVGPTELQATSVSAGTYGAANITVDADGRITNASAGSLTGLSNVGSATITAGNLLVADGTKFQSVTMSNDCTLASDGAITCTNGGANSLTGLSDVGSASVTAANILVADGTKFQSVGVSGDITITSAGVSAIGNDKVGSAQISSSGVTAGTYGAANITVDADGRVTNASAGSLTGLSNVGSATITAGNLLVADGTKFQSVTMSNDCTLASDGAITCTNGGATSLTGLSDVGSAATTQGNILAADGTKFQSVGSLATTTGTGVNLTANSLTTGKIASFVSNSADTDTRTLVQITNDNSAAVGAAGLTIIQDSLGPALQITGAGGNILVGRTDTNGNPLMPLIVDMSGVASLPEFDSSDDCSVVPCVGVVGFPRVDNPANPNFSIGMVGQIETADSAFTLTNAVAFMAEDAILGATSTITNQYGVFIKDQTAGSKSWGLYAEGTNNLNYFGGKVGIGTTGPAEMLHVVGNARISSLASCAVVQSDSNGVLSCGGAGSGSLTGLSDVGSAATTQGNILAADGTKFQSVGSLATTTGTGVNLTADSLTTGKIASFVSNSADTDTRTLVQITNDNSAAVGAMPLVIQQDSISPAFRFTGAGGGLFMGPDAFLGATTVVGALFMPNFDSDDDCNNAGGVCLGILGSPIIDDPANPGAVGVQGQIQTANTAFTLPSGIAILAEDANKGAASTITNQYGVFIADQTKGTNKWGLYAAGATNLNYIGHNLGIGTTGPSEMLHVVGNARVSSLASCANVISDANGVLSCGSTGGALSLTGLSDVGSAATTQGNILAADGTKFQSVGSLATTTGTGVNLTANSLTTGKIASFVSNSADTDTRTLVQITNDNSAAVGATGLVIQQDSVQPGLLVTGDGGGLGVGQYLGPGAGIFSTTTFDSADDCTSGACYGIVSRPTADNPTNPDGLIAVAGIVKTANTAFTLANAIGIYAPNAEKGGASTITNQFGVLIDDQTQGVKNWGLYSAGTTNLNYFGGKVGIGTTDPAEMLHVVGNARVSSLASCSTIVSDGNGVLSCGSPGVGSLTGLSDVGSAATTQGNILAADGTKFQSVGSLATTTGTGVNLTANSLTTGKIASFVSNSADTDTRTLVQITNDNSAAIGATALTIQQDSSAPALRIKEGHIFMGPDNFVSFSPVLGIAALPMFNTSTDCGAGGCSGVVGVPIVDDPTNPTVSGVSGQILVADTAFTLDNAIAIRAQDAQELGGASATITNQYGVFIEDQIHGANNWGLYSGGNTNLNYFGGKVGIGITGPSEMLHVVGNARVSSLASCSTIVSDGNGVLSCGSPGAGSLTGLSDVGSAATTQGNILAADGTKFQSVGSLATTTGTGVNLVANSLTTGKIASFVSNSADTDTRTLIQITNDNSAAIAATALTIQQDSKAPAIYLSGSGGGIFYGNPAFIGASSLIGAGISPVFDSTDDCNGAGGACVGVISSPTAADPVNPSVASFSSIVQTDGSGFTLNNAFGLYAGDANKDGADTITNQYGVYIQDQTQGANNWGLYSAGTTNLNYFGGKVGIGTTGPSEELHVVGDARISSLASCSTIVSDGNGVLSCGSPGAGSLTGLSDVGSAATTQGNILAADGTKFQSVGSLATTTGTGVNLVANSLTTGKIASFVSNSADTDTRTLVQITNDDSGAFGATGLTVQQDSIAPAIQITGSGGNFYLGPTSLVTISPLVGGAFIPTFDVGDDCNLLGSTGCTAMAALAFADNPTNPTITAVFGQLHLADAAFTLTNGYAIYASNLIKEGAASASVTNQYGVYIEEQNQATKNFGLYAAGTTNLNYFGGKVGIGTTGPNSSLSVAGSQSVGVVTIDDGDDPYTAAATDYAILVDTTNASITVNLPAAAGASGRVYHVKKLVAANTITIDGNGGETIDGSATRTITNQYESVTIVSDGSNWWVI